MLPDGCQTILMRPCALGLHAFTARCKSCQIDLLLLVLDFDCHNHLRGSDCPDAGAHDDARLCRDADQPIVAISASPSMRGKPYAPGTTAAGRRTGGSSVSASASCSAYATA